MLKDALFGFEIWNKGWNTDELVNNSMSFSLIILSEFLCVCFFSALILIYASPFY